MGGPHADDTHCLSFTTKRRPSNNILPLSLRCFQLQCSGAVRRSDWLQRWTHAAAAALPRPVRALQGGPACAAGAAALLHRLHPRCCCCTVASLGSAAALLHPPCVRQLQQHKDFCPALSRTLPRGKRGAVAHPQPSSGMQYHLQRTSAPAKLQARPRSRGVPSDEHCCYAITGCVLLNCD